MALHKIKVYYTEKNNDIDSWCTAFSKHLQAVFHSYISKDVVFEVAGLIDFTHNKGGVVVYNSSHASVSQINATNPLAVICFDDFDTSMLSNVFMFSIHIKNGNHRLTADSELFHNDYWIRVVDCSFAINHQLGSGADNLQVYLGEVGADQQQNRDILRRELLHLGYTVVPATTLPADASIAEKSIKKMLSTSVAAVLLIGTDIGKHVDGAKIGIVEYQHTILRQHIAAQEAPIPLVFLFEDFGQFTTDAQLSYLQRMQMSIDTDSGAEVLQMPVEKLKQELLPIITAGIAKDIASQHTGTDTSWYILGKHSSPIFNGCIHALAGTGITLTLDENLSPAEKLLQHRKHLVNADRVVLCYEEQPSEWLIAMLQDVLKSPGFGRKKMFDKIILAHNSQSLPEMKMILPYIKTLPLIEHECGTGTDLTKFLKNS